MTDVDSTGRGQSARTILHLSYPLTPKQREQFYQRVAQELGLLPEIGPGLIYKIAAAAQREILDVPVIDGTDD